MSDASVRDSSMLPEPSSSLPDNSSRKDSREMGDAGDPKGELDVDEEAISKLALVMMMNQRTSIWFDGLRCLQVGER